MKNFVRVRGTSVFSVCYAFVDTEEHNYVTFFSDAGIKVKKKKVFIKPGTGLRLVVCKILKRDIEAFEKKVAEVRNRALLLGYTNYDEFCVKLCELDAETIS